MASGFYEAGKVCSVLKTDCPLSCVHEGEGGGVSGWWAWLQLVGVAPGRPLPTEPGLFPPPHTTQVS